MDNLVSETWSQGHPREQLGSALYDVFISYNESDRTWVQDKLLPRLERAGLRVAIDYRDFIVGMPRLENIERAIEHSRRTIVVLTPAWLASDWNAFESLLLSAIDPAARRRKLLPVLLKPCEALPTRIASLEKVDLTNERYVNKQLQRLIRDIEDVIPVVPPWQKPGGLVDLTYWRRWLRRYRRRLVWSATGILALILTGLMFFELPPFEQRQVWMGELLQTPAGPASTAVVLHNTSTALVVGETNIEHGCTHPHKGLWYRLLKPGNTWRESKVGEALCFQKGGNWFLSDIVELASLAADPNTVYALTSHSGLLVSSDAGAQFSRHPATETWPGLELDNRPGTTLLVVRGQQTPIFWVALENFSLQVYQDEQWTRLDGGGAGGCAGLPALTFTALLVTDQVILIGSDRQGLWVSQDGGHTCRQVFDAAGYYEFHGLWDVSPRTHARYLVLVRDWGREPEEGPWQLLNLCPLSTSCRQTEWQVETNPVWQEDSTFWQSPVWDVLVQPSQTSDYEWYLITEVGRIWRGDLQGGQPERLPGLTRCFNIFSSPCNANFAPAGPGDYPYLLAANRVYQYTEGAWWRRWWP